MRAARDPGRRRGLGPGFREAGREGFIMEERRAEGGHPAGVVGVIGCRGG